MTSNGTPASGKQDTGNCEHEWIEIVVYDGATNMEKRYLECRLCAANAGQNVNTRIHGSKTINLAIPELNMEWKYKGTVGYIGRGINTWYPAED